MKEETGDLWNIWCPPFRGARCITTNGTLKSNGSAVMGRGCAREALNMDPTLAYNLGNWIRDFGNRVHCLRRRLDRPALLSFPVKHEWMEPADLSLIVASCHGLERKADELGLRRILLPKPGCGNGRLDWEDVEPVISELLSDRVVVIDRG